MATYGPNSGTVPFTGFTPTLGDADAVNSAASGTIQRNGLSNSDAPLARMLTSHPMRPIREVLLTLVNGNVGDAASETYKRRRGVTSVDDTTALGGLVTIDTTTLISRNTAAADQTNLTALLTREPKPATYVADASGNGGGGKAGF